MIFIRLELETKIIERITDLPFSDETSPVADATGKELLFISDLHGINNIYKINLNGNNPADTSAIIPVTNSVSGLYQLSASKDAKKLTFSSLNQSSFNLFQMTNPFDSRLEGGELKATLFIDELLKLTKKRTF
jgi:Tol biopolymer transport system component